MINTERLQLRPVSMDDLSIVHALHSLPETDYYNTLGIPESIRETEKVISDWLIAMENPEQPKHVFYIENHQKEFIGIFGINIARPKIKSAEIWYKLHPSHWNRGYATEAVNWCLQFCFDELGLHRIEAGCAVANIASYKVMEKVGMQREGIKRKVLPIRGEWVDGYLYAILNEDRKQ